MSKLGPISNFFSPVPCDSLMLQVSGVKGTQVCKIWCYCSHSLILVTGSSTWHLMAKNSEDLKKKELLLYKKMAWAIRRLPRPWNWAAARWPRPYSGLTGQVPLRTGLAMVDQRSWVHVLSVISRGCVWEIDVWVLPALLQRLKGWGVSLSLLRPYTTQCIKLVCMAAIPEENSSKDDAQERPQTVCWRQAD